MYAQVWSVSGVEYIICTDYELLLANGYYVSMQENINNGEFNAPDLVQSIASPWQQLGENACCGSDRADGHSKNLYINQNLYTIVVSTVMRSTA